MNLIVLFSITYLHTIQKNYNIFKFTNIFLQIRKSHSFQLRNSIGNIHAEFHQSSKSLE
jgi:hypothetical protein